MHHTLKLRFLFHPREKWWFFLSTFTIFHHHLNSPLILPSLHLLNHKLLPNDTENTLENDTGTYKNGKSPKNTTQYLLLLQQLPPPHKLHPPWGLTPSLHSLTSYFPHTTLTLSHHYTRINHYHTPRDYGGKGVCGNLDKQKVQISEARWNGCSRDQTTRPHHPVLATIFHLSTA